jgi:hypothetical protein
MPGPIYVELRVAAPTVSNGAWTKRGKRESNDCLEDLSISSAHPVKIKVEKFLRISRARCYLLSKMKQWLSLRIIIGNADAPQRQWVNSLPDVDIVYDRSTLAMEHEPDNNVERWTEEVSPPELHAMLREGVREYAAQCHWERKH